MAGMIGDRGRHTPGVDLHLPADAVAIPRLSTSPNRSSTETRVIMLLYGCILDLIRFIRNDLSTTPGLPMYFSDDLKRMNRTELGTSNVVIRLSGSDIPSAAVDDQIGFS